MSLVGAYRSGIRKGAACWCVGDGGKFYLVMGKWEWERKLGDGKVGMGKWA